MIFTATLYNNIALLFKEKLEYDMSLDYYLKSVGIYEKYKGYNHIYTATLYNNIGLLYCLKE